MSRTMCGKPIHVGFIQRRVDFIEHAERAGPVAEQRDQKRKRRQRLLSARKQQHILKLLSRRLRDDLDAGIGLVRSFQQPQFAVTAAEKMDEGFRESGIDRFEGFLELPPADGIDFLDGLSGVANGIEQVLTLAAQELEPLLRLPDIPPRPSC